MILLVRLDDRLLHGQVAYSLKSALNYEAIVIADDDVVNDDIRKETLKLCKPDDVRISIRDIEGAIKVVNDKRTENMKMLVIVSSPESAYRFYKKLLEISIYKPKFNIAGVSMMENRKMIANSCYLSEDELKLIDKIYEMGIDIEIQLVPSSPVVKYESIRNK